LPGAVHNPRVQTPLHNMPLERAGRRGRMATRRGQVVVVLGESADNAVINNDAGIVDHKGVARGTGLGIGHACGISPFQQPAGIGPHDFDLAQRRYVDKTNAAPHGINLGFDPRIGVIRRAVVADA